MEARQSPIAGIAARQERREDYRRRYGYPGPGYYGHGPYYPY